MPHTAVHKALNQALRRDLLRFVQNRVGSSPDAEDLVQEIFLRIARKYPALEDETRLVPWVYTIARNVVVDHYRSHRNHDALPEGLSEGPHDPRLPDNDNHLVGGWLHLFLEALPEHYREAVRLADVEGLTQRAVADRLGLSFPGAKSRIQRGRRALRDMLTACCDVEFDAHGNAVDWQKRDSCC